MLSSIGVLSQPYYHFAPHIHDNWEVVCYTYGSGHITIGDQSYRFTEGDVFIQPPGVAHSEDSPSGYENIHMELSSLPQSLAGVRRLHDSSTSDLRALMMMVYRAYFWHDMPNEALIASLLEVIYQVMQGLSSASRRSKYVDQMKAIIIANMSNPEFSLRDMYREVHLNEDHARRIFQAEMHVSPMNYLSQLRVRRACSMLSSMPDNLSVRLVGELVGIRDPYYFSRLFKQHTGKSPQNWMKQMGADERVYMAR